MASVQLVALCVALWAFLPCRSRDCLSHCCNENEIMEAGHQLTSRLQVPKHLSSPMECKASSEGHVSERSISPWRYEKDEDSSRYPFRLWQARCNCPRCLALKPALKPGTHTEDVSHHGNSVPVNYTTIVFFRTKCGTDPGRFNLVPQTYTVNVSCTCVFHK
ncbi:interleukin-25 [Paroedura picta]|uniref:interleukin-25 n=1 Tax=Paroedura picta TaxID=143630 RepID=UPI00405630BB